ncbi:flagellar FliJ protein [Chromohalobacter marismortui]|uniref:Flagellar FliJ protein n=1 Tax=Chromohalobacter marismortui TaxID=42055 RepID=A0A4R7NPV8_9GAMM|nr:MULTISPECIES: flagellar export protein FliJ [Chromohalobacter]MCI0508858.1 flagella biosynthesis chaperone FliJ [Chromohalobacter sp.]MCI0594285.1 flagella biosynthesis chaperone FliJ [Chromohalobacter sp.]TDU22768.1 flagellar FliJ protein [Chromohalobacter marismortui]
MNARSPLTTLKELAQETCDQAARSVGHSQRSLQEAQQRLDQLLNYRHEYRQRLDASMEKGIEPANWHNYQQFLASLDQAIAGQRKALNDQQRQLDRQQQAWQGEKRKLNTYDTLVSRREQSEQKRAIRREQQLFDEMSARMSRQQKNDRGLGVTATDTSHSNDRF